VSTEELQVKFGGDTRDLEAAASKAKGHVETVGHSVQGLEQVFHGAKEAFVEFAAQLKLGWAAGLVSGASEAKTALAGMTAETGGGILGMSALTLGVVGVGAAMVAAIPALIEWESQFGKMALKLDQMSQKLGIAVEDASRWQSVAQMAGMSGESLAGSMTRLERATYMAANGGKRQAEAFQQLGINVREAKNPSELMLQIADKFKDMDNGPKKIALAMTLMGRAGATMIPTFNKGKEAIEEMFKTSDELGATVTKSMTEAGLAVHESTDLMELGFQGVRNMLYEALAPVVVVVTEAIADLIKSMVKSYKEGGLVADMVGILSGAFKGIVTVILSVAAGFEELYHIAVAALEAIIGKAYAVGKALQAGLSGNFSGMADAYNKGMDATHAAQRVQLGKIYDTNRTYAERLSKLWGATPLGPKSSNEAPPDMDLDGPGGKGKKDKKGKDTSAEERRAAEKLLQQEIEDIDYKKDLAKGLFEVQLQLEDEKLQKIKEFYGEDSREYTKALRERLKFVQQHNQEVVKLEQEKIAKLAQIAQSKADTDNQIDQITLDRKKQHESSLEQMGVIKGAAIIAAMRQEQAEEQQLQIAHENNIYRIKADSLREQLKLPNLLPAEALKLNGQLELIEAEHQNKMRVLVSQNSAAIAAINDKAAEQTMQKWAGIIDPIANTFATGLDKMLNGTQSFASVMLQIGDQIVASFIQAGVKMVAHWLTMQLAKTSATVAGEATRTGVETAAAGKSILTSAISAIARIAHLAAVAAAGAYAAIASIPIVGPFLAPAIAAAALIGVIKLGASVLSASQGFDVPAGTNPLTQLHEKEMVLPANIAEPMRRMLAGAGPTEGSGGLMQSAMSAGNSVRSESRSSESTFNYQPQVNHSDASLETMLSREGATMRSWFRNEARNGKFGLTEGV